MLKVLKSCLWLLLIFDRRYRNNIVSSFVPNCAYEKSPKICLARNWNMLPQHCKDSKISFAMFKHYVTEWMEESERDNVFYYY